MDFKQASSKEKEKEGSIALNPLLSNRQTASDLPPTTLQGQGKLICDCDRKEQGTTGLELQNKAASTKDLVFTFCVFRGLSPGPALNLFLRTERRLLVQFS